MKRIIATLAACTAMTSFPVMGATQAQIAQATQLLNTKKPADALALLEASHTAAEASVQEFFMMGLSAKLSGKLGKAEQYFRSALKREPSAGRIRLELAEVLFSQRKLDAARSELLTVRNMNPPAQVRQNIDGFIAQIDTVKANPNKFAQGPQKSWSGYITTGFTSDSNVNAGPDTDSVFLYGLPFTLSSAAQETKDSAWFLRAGLSHQFKLDNGAVWRSNAYLAFNNYFNTDAYDTTTFNASTGPSFRLGKKVGVFLPITFNMQSYNEQGGWYSQSWAIAPQFQYALQDNLQLRIGVSAGHKRFNRNSTRDLNSYTLNPSLNFQPTKSGNIAIGVNFGHEDSDLNIYTNDVRGAYIGYQHNFREQGIRASVTASYTDTQFEGIQAAYTVARHDTSRKLGASVTYLLPKLQGASVSATTSYQDNNSNLDINTYGRALFSLSFTKRF